MDDWSHDSDADVDHVIGAFYAMRRDLFMALGGFDERFFVYLEDLDLSLRVREAGLRVRFLASPPSFHVGGGVSRQIKATRLFYATRSRILYAYKHFGKTLAHLHLALSLVVEPITRSIHALARLSPSALAETCRAFAMLWANMPAILRNLQR
jgi:GT2 family glycosyltransferase